VKLSVAAIVKDEADTLLEWIAFHRVIGVDGFFIADNESTDGTRELLHKLARLSIVDILPFKTPDDGNAQIPAYSALLQRARGKCEILAFIDADEYIMPTDGKLSILPFIEHHFSDQDVSAVALNWANFGSSGELFASEGLVIDRFFRRAKLEFGVHHHIKSLVRPDRVSGWLNPHLAILDGGRYVHASGKDIEHHPKHGRGLTLEIDWEGARVNHYATKSLEEFLIGKSRRGSASKKSRIKHKSYFQRHDRNDESCLIARQFVPAVLQEIKRLEVEMACQPGNSVVDTPAPSKPRNSFTFRRFLRDALSSRQS
jgi:glycosyltransferase involved in cell wall biosynthesis